MQFQEIVESGKNTVVKIERHTLVFRIFEKAESGGKNRGLKYTT